jgi:hypothetical protein
VRDKGKEECVGHTLSVTWMKRVGVWVEGKAHAFLKTRIHPFFKKMFHFSNKIGDVSTKGSVSFESVRVREVSEGGVW